MAGAGQVETEFPGNRIFQGHLGAAMIAAGLLRRDLDLSPTANDELSRCVESLKADDEWSLMNPKKAGSDGDLRTFLDAVNDAARNLSRSGHGVIYGMLILRALEEADDLATPTLYGALTNLIRSGDAERPDPRYFGVPWNYQSIDPPDDVIPRYSDDDTMLRVTFDELDELYDDADVDGVYYYFSGERLHNLTYAHAIVELNRLGYSEITQSAYVTHRQQAFLNRMIPPPNARTRIPSAQVPLASAPFWTGILEADQQLAVPHGIKRSWNLLSLMQLESVEHHPNLPAVVDQVTGAMLK